ncbi:MAG: M48 family metallopeptidase [Rhodocyclaceae bacterium]|nr:M48 family metallopeptidase [Rhodocyclaceae bacterium]
MEIERALLADGERRRRRQQRLTAMLTLRAGFGLAALAALVFAVLAFGLWFAFAGNGEQFALRIVAALALVFAAGQLLSWLWQPPSEIAGVTLSRVESPGLFDELDRLCAHYRLAPIDRVMIGSDINATVVQLPELGLWGRLRTTLVVGLPLLHSLSPEQLRAILAHELSHVALQRRLFAAWAAQMRAWWHRVLMAMEEDQTVVGWSATRMLAWHAYDYLLDSVELAHLEEFEADGAAADIVGAQCLGGALIEVAMKERYLREEYWDAVMSQFEYPAQGGPILPFREMGVGVALGFRRSEQAGRMGELLQAAPGLELHPCLNDRLAAIQVAPHSTFGRGPSAADRYLGKTASDLACRLDRAWCMALAPCCK